MDWAKQVYDFLFENRVISMMSILGDMQDYHPACNSVNTQRGFALALAGFADDKQKRMQEICLSILW